MCEAACLAFYLFTLLFYLPFLTAAFEVSVGLLLKVWKLRLGRISSYQHLAWVPNTELRTVGAHIERTPFRVSSEKNKSMSVTREEESYDIYTAVQA